MTYYDQVNGINIYLGSKCNSDCIYCRDKYLGNHLEISDNNIDELIANLNKFKYLSKIIFVGGETLLYYDYIKKIINRLNNKFVKYTILTNGTSFNKDITDFIIKNRIHVRFSHDGYCHQITRGCNPFDNKEAHDSIRKLSQLGQLSLTTVISHYNYDFVKNHYYFIDKIGGSFTYIPIVVQYHDELLKDLDIDKFREYYRNFINLCIYDRIIARYLLYYTFWYYYTNNRLELFVDTYLNIIKDSHNFTIIGNLNNESDIKLSLELSRISLPIFSDECHDCELKNICKWRITEGCCSDPMKKIRIVMNEEVGKLIRKLGFSNILEFNNFLMRIIK